MPDPVNDIALGDDRKMRKPSIIRSSKRNYTIFQQFSVVT